MTERPFPCKCTLSQRLVGDGCDICNPELAAELAWEQGAGDWPEDFSHENGNYGNICGNCGAEFIGHKRRVRCKPCMTGIQQDSSTMGRPRKRVASLFKVKK